MYNLCSYSEYKTRHNICKCQKANKQEKFQCAVFMVAAALKFEASESHRLLSGQNQDPGRVRRAHAGVGVLPPHRAAVHREFERSQTAPAGPGRPDAGGEADPAGLPPGLPAGGRTHREAHAVWRHLSLPGRGAHHRRQPGLQVAICERSRPERDSFSGGWPRRICGDLMRLFLCAAGVSLGQARGSQ